MAVSGCGNPQNELHKAAKIDDVAEINRQIKPAPIVNAMGEYGVTSLHWAAIAGHADAVIALIEGDADVRATTNDEKPPLAIAKKHKKWSVVAIL